MGNKGEVFTAVFIIVGLITGYCFYLSSKGRKHLDIRRDNGTMTDTNIGDGNNGYIHSTP